MQVIPVIDLMGGQVVRGVAGRREAYLPIQSQIAADARPATVARALVEQFGINAVYVADLDAIVHGRPDVQAWSEIAGAGLKLWLDAGVKDAQVGRQVVDQLMTITTDFELIVGLESLTSLEALLPIAKLCGGPIVSLDLKAGVPQTQIEQLHDAKPIDIARILCEEPIYGLIVLDVADVGMNTGVSTIELCRGISAKYRGRLISGGGVRTFGDLQTLADAGCSGALVASALHDGRLTRADVKRARQLVRSRGGRLPDVSAHGRASNQFDF